jgi:hypothetical protein
MISWDVERAGHEPSVRLDGSRIIPDVPAKVETGEVPHARSALS